MLQPCEPHHLLGSGELRCGLYGQFGDEIRVSPLQEIALFLFT
jgi:hypothetical protein